MTTPAELTIAAWQAASADLALLEDQLAQAMRECLRTRADPPRQLIIDTERKREDVQRLFELAVDALDAQSSTRTGHTNFGTL